MFSFECINKNIDRNSSDIGIGVEFSGEQVSPNVLTVQALTLKKLRRKCINYEQQRNVFRTRSANFFVVVRMLMIEVANVT